MIRESAQIQKLPLSKKNKDWREAQVDYVIGATYSSSSAKTAEDMNKSINLYLGNFDIEDIRYVVNPFDVEDGFPATPHNINIIKPKVDLLIGEEINTRLPLRVLCTSQKASEEINSKMVNDLTTFMLQMAISKMDDQTLADFDQKVKSGEISDPKEILGLSGSLEYKSLIEESARSLLEYISQKSGLKDVFTSGFFNLLWAGKSLYHVSIQSGNPVIENVNPIEFRNVYSSNNSSELYRRIEDSEMICRTVYMTPTEVYDRLYHLCTEKDLDDILALTSSGQSRMAYKNVREPDYIHIKMNKLDIPSTIDGMVPVYHVLWKSFKKIGFLTYQNEDGTVSSEIVSEDYVKTGNEISLTWDWIPEIWEGYRVSDSIYLGVNPLQYQYMNKENILDQKMPYFGIELVGSKSIIDLLKPLQYLYIIVWYRLELALARDKGKILSMDVRKVPKSLGVDVNKWLHLLSSVGVNFYNPDETGWDNDEDNRADRSNDGKMIQSEDLSMSNTIASYVQILEMIEGVAEHITGISRQRSGFIKSSEYVGAVQQSIGQSNLITENIFDAHDSCRTAVVRYFLNMAKDYYYDTDNKFLSYITSDGARNAVNLSDDFFYEDYDVFAVSSRQESKDLELIKQLYQPAMQNGMSLSDIAEIISLNSTKAIHGKLKEIEERRIMEMQRAQEAEMQRENELLELKRNEAEIESQLRMQELELEKYKIDTTNSTKIAVAELQALGFANNNSENSEEDSIINRAKSLSDISNKRAKEYMEQIKEANKNSLKRAEISLKKEKIAADKKMDSEKIKLEKEKLAIERQKIKSYSKK